MNNYLIILKINKIKMIHNIYLIKEPIDYIIEDFAQGYAQWLELAKLTASYVLAAGVFVLVAKSFTN